MIKNEKEILRAATFVLEKPVETLSDLSDNQLVFFASLSPNELNRCFALQDVLNGRSYREVAISYRISKSRLEEMAKYSSY